MCESLDRMREEARAEGMILGRRDGLIQGKTVGIQIGRIQGESEGLQKGRIQGKEEGVLTVLKSLLKKEYRILIFWKLPEFLLNY